MKVTLMDHMGDDLTTVNAARVSYAKESDTLSKSDKGLIHYLAEHEHNSPFYHPQAMFRVKAPIFVARQLMRHNVSHAYNEMSRRYVEDEPEFYMPDEFRQRPAVGQTKQGSGDPLKGDTQRQAKEAVAWIYERSLVTYKELLALGVAAEQARMVLPLGMYTEWVWTGSLYAIFKMWRERTHPNAQLETQYIARSMGVHMAMLFPTCWATLIKEQGGHSDTT